MSRLSGMITGMLVVAVGLAVFMFYVSDSDTGINEDTIPHNQEAGKIVKIKEQQEIQGNEKFEGGNLVIDGDAPHSADPGKLISSGTDEDSGGIIEEPVKSAENVEVIEAAEDESTEADEIIEPAEADKITEVIESIENNDAEWHIFWGPFRTLASAEGFSSRMETATGLKMKVLAKGDSDFRIAFPYGDEAEKLKNIQLIEEKSSLKIMK